MPWITRHLPPIQKNRSEKCPCAADQGLAAKVKSLVYFGTDTHCHLALGDGTELVARLQNPVSGEAGLTEGQTVGVTFAKGAVQRVEY